MTRAVSAADELPERTIGPIAAADIVRFAGAGGDFNPLHFDPEVARAAGFPGVIAMGQLHAGMLAAWVSDAFGVEHLRVFEVRFVSPVLVGDTLRCRGLVTSVADVAGETVAELDLVMENDRGVVITATASVAVVS